MDGISTVPERNIFNYCGMVDYSLLTKNNLKFFNMDILTSTEKC